MLIHQNKRKRQLGAEMVEFVVTLPIIILIAFILIELAVALNNQAVFTDASRAAALEIARGSTEAAARAAATNILKSRIPWYQEGAQPVVSFNPQIWNLTNQPGRPVEVTVAQPFAFHLIPRLVPVLWLKEFQLPQIQIRGRTVMYEQKH